MKVNPKLLQEVEVPVPSPKAFNLVDWKLLESVLLWQTRNVGPGPVAPRTCRLLIHVARAHDTSISHIEGYVARA